MKPPDLSERFRSRLVGAAMVAYGLVVLVSAAITLSPEPVPTALIDEGDWELQGAWMKVHPQEVAVRATTLDSAQTVFYRSRTKPGDIATPAFVPPRYISIPINGFSYVAGRENDVYLECLESGERLPVARANTNNQWAEAVFPIAPDWCNSEVTLNAHAESRSRIVSLGPPVAVSALAYLKTRGIGQVFIHLIVFLALFSVSLAGALLFAKSGFRTAPFAAQFVALGLAGLLMFFVMDASAKLGAGLAWLLVLAAPMVIGVLYRQDRDSVRHYVARLRWPAAIWFLGSLGFLMLLYSVDNGGGSWSANFRFAPASWSSDNQLPLFVSEALADGEDMRSFKMGPWRVSDRPPLMTGLVCLVRPLIRWAQSHNDGDHLYYHGYHTTGILVNALWLPAVFFVL